MRTSRERAREAAGVTRQEAESVHMDPDLPGLRTPRTEGPRWSLPGPCAQVHLAGAAGLGGRRQALRYLPPSCPRPRPDITEWGKGEPVGGSAAHLGSPPARGPETSTAWGPGASGG